VIEYGNRARNLPAPPSIVWRDLVEPRSGGARPWLRLLSDEVPPRVLDAQIPSRVVWSSLWPTRPDDRIAFELSAKHEGTSLRFRLLAAGDPPDDSKTGHLRKRVNHLLFADLRSTYGQ
jgi:hypothetical protein